MSKSFHMAISVDIDRFDDATLRRNWCRYYPQFRTPAKLRKMCEEARKQGLDAFPPCDNVDEKGHCKGHEEPSK